MGASLVHGATVLRTAEGRGPSQLCMRRVLPPQPMAFENFCALYSTSTWRGRLGNSRYSLDTYCHISTPRRRRRRRGSVIRTSWRSIALK